MVGRPLPGRLGDRDGCDPHRPLGADQRGVGHDGEARGTGGLDAGSRRARPHVDDAGDGDAGRREVERRPIGGVVTRHDDDSRPGLTP